MTSQETSEGGRTPPAPTVVVLTTPAGAGGIAVVELYGPTASRVLEACFRARVAGLPENGELRLGTLVDHRGEVVDEVVVAPFAAASSWCGVEGWSVSCHGGPAVTEAVIGVLTHLGAVLQHAEELLEAQPGRRFDLSRRQAFALFVRAPTERVARYFLRMYEGALARRLDALADRVERDAGGHDAGGHDAVLGEIDLMVEQSRWAVRLAEPLRVLIAGRPNVGKSTLFNALLGEDRAIVTRLPGTTRDLIEEVIEIEGFPVTMLDGAGFRSRAAAEVVEWQGIERLLTVDRDALLFVSDRDGPLLEEEAALLDRLGDPECLRVRSKADLGRGEARGEPGEGALPVCSLSGEGIEALRERMRLAWLGPGEDVELPPLPFTPELVDRVRNVGAALRRRAPGDLDGIRHAFIECLR